MKLNYPTTLYNIYVKLPKRRSQDGATKSETQLRLLTVNSEILGLSALTVDEMGFMVLTNTSAKLSI